ncbi:MAG TPA: Gfo/Idh/MocA family oxidoreductase [Phycisphaerae bacterium]|nr:Gfo/Idh/MocA family oxidoreductase [Phycisphaerae bacterium]
MPSHHPVTRRLFLKTAAAALAGPYIVPSSVMGEERPAPSNRIAVAIVGTGGQGGGHVRGLANNNEVQVVGVSDTDRGRRYGNRDWVNQHYGKSAPGGTYSGCMEFADFRDVIYRPEVDAVLVAAPDHWHGLISTWAMKAGKDVYCEKPMASTIGDGRASADAAQRYGRVFQTGTQERSGQARVACELVRNGRIGRLHTIRTYLPMEAHCLAPQGDAPPTPVPEGFDYNMWLGPAPWEPYTPKRCHFNFRWILDYSDGELTDRGAHVNDIALWGAGPLLTGPVDIVATEGKFRNDTLWDVPIHFHIEYKYSSGLQIICESSGQRGIRFEGTEGWIFVAIHGGHLTASRPEILKSVIGPNEIHYHQSRGGHHGDWIYAMQTRGPTVAPAEDGHRTASFCHLGIIALLMERPLKWDLDKERFIGDDEASAYVNRPMRSPWHL